ncbi:MAG TPA: hypothetical protein VKE96_31145 [Vicinamibacterales bacterium]|nr:hypothetical protein [Vicinamibacterales bacterium]
MCARIPALDIRRMTGRERRERLIRALIAGAAAGGAGFSGFVTVHSFLIAPIWGRSVQGIQSALLAGIALAWAFEAHHGNEIVRPLSDGARFGAIIFATLVPATVFANAMRFAGLHPNDWPGLVMPTAIAAAAGAVAGWRLTGHVRETAVATIALTVAMAGQIPVVNSPRAAWLFVAFLPLCIAGGITLAISRQC